MEVTVDQLSKAEERAIAATKFAPFPIQLHEVRRTVKQILDLFGRNNFFAEYTVHDFSHVEAMLSDLEWLITERTKSILTPTDWLMITLAIYFHDLGLIVTEDEFQKRSLAGFQKFCDDILFAKNDGKDYKIKVETLGADRAERFFYQEFVRYNHAKRVRAWIEGKTAEELGYALTQADELNRLLGSLDSDFRKDLAIVCESHNLDDLEDFKKYKPFRPYGPSPAETANVLYAAAILRTTDLLQITKNRAPSVMFRMINPTDPISQIEWTKQNAVKGIFPTPAMDKNGAVNKDVQPDSVTVFAKFDNENGFFGLTSYLAYAAKQLFYSYSCVQKANLITANKVEFPWRGIDDSQVEAVGFIPNPFEFQIDQTKILDLLTGHTLYNDSSVALRELMQNAIDAVRLQNTHTPEIGKIVVTWSTADLTLTIRDNGTGMTQEIIERHLLNVGSSRYQDPKFKERFPDFSPISRFGIGVLSTFMVADNVQIVTFHEEEEQGRRISLRSVHGKYLIRLLDKSDSEEAKEIGAHGTKVILKMRASSERVDVLQTLQRWILFPRCNIVAEIDDSSPIEIGFSSPKAALEAYLTDTKLGLKPELLRVHEKTIGDTTLAFASVYNSHFRDRAFLVMSDSMHQKADGVPPTGICIEGIRVQFEPPGSHSRSGILSIVNCNGRDAPKTNVARSSLESDADKIHLASKVLDAYLDQVKDEVARLQEEEGFSLSYAIEQFPFIAGPLYSGQIFVRGDYDGFKEFPMFMVEDQQGRRAASINELISTDGFWSVESNSMSSLVDLLKDTPANVTCKQVAEFSKFKGAPLPSGNLVTNSSLSSVAHQLVESHFEISELRASTDDRRVDSRWTPLDRANPKWLYAIDVEKDALHQRQDDLRIYRRLREARRHSHSRGDIQIALKDFPITGLENFFAVIAMGKRRLLPNTPVAKFLIGLDCKNNPQNTLQFLIFLDALAASIGHSRTDRKLAKAEIEYSLKEVTARFDQNLKMDVIGFLRAVSETEGRLAMFDPWSWHRNENSPEEDGLEWMPNFN
jgi:molecular chaperone HtpG